MTWAHTSLVLGDPSSFASFHEAQEGVFHLFHVVNRLFTERISRMLAKYLELIFYGPQTLLQHVGTCLILEGTLVERGKLLLQLCSFQLQCLLLDFLLLFSHLFLNTIPFRVRVNFTAWPGLGLAFQKLLAVGL